MLPFMRDVGKASLFPLFFLKVVRDITHLLYHVFHNEQIC